MTIKRGQEWGVAVARPPGLVVLPSDAALAAAVAADPTGDYAVSGGDLHRSLGSPAVGERSELHRVTIDLLQVEADGHPHVAVAHAVMRRSWWRGRVVAAMNADHLGTWYVAPRAHPNDGRVDVVEAGPTLSLRDRWTARSRLPQGTHVPHPEVTVRASVRAEWTFGEPIDLWLDGVNAGRVRCVEITVASDAFALHV